MQDVVWDMVIQADQYSSYMAKDSAHINIKLERLRLYEQVFQLHSVSRDQFKKSYDYYMAHPELAQTLFDSLISKGNRLRSEAYSHPSVRPAVTVSTPATDTAHKSPVQPSLLPLFKHPMPYGVHPLSKPGQHTPDSGHRLPHPGHLLSDSNRSSSKKPLP